MQKSITGRMLNLVERNDHGSCLVTSLQHSIPCDIDYQCHYYHRFCKNPPLTQAQYVPHNKPRIGRFIVGRRGRASVRVPPA